MKPPSSLSPRTLTRVKAGLADSRAGRTSYLGSFSDDARIAVRYAAAAAADAMEALAKAQTAYAPTRHMAAVSTAISRDLMGLTCAP